MGNSSSGRTSSSEGNSSLGNSSLEFIFNASAEFVFGEEFVFRGQFVFGECIWGIPLRGGVRLQGQFVFGQFVFRVRLRGGVRLRGAIRLRGMHLRNLSSSAGEKVIPAQRPPYTHIYIIYIYVLSLIPSATCRIYLCGPCWHLQHGPPAVHLQKHRGRRIQRHVVSHRHATQLGPSAGSIGAKKNTMAVKNGNFTKQNGDLMVLDLQKYKKN